MSRRRRAGFSEGKRPVLIDRLLKGRVFGRLLDQVHLAAEDRRQFGPQVLESAEVVEAAPGKSRRQSHGQVYVRGGRHLVASDRANSDRLATPARLSSCSCARSTAIARSRGDVAMRDEDGYITYVGRTDDVFKASDYRISPFELESVLAQHEAVAEAAVVPSPDELRLAVPKAVIELAEGFEPNGMLAQELLRFARVRLATYKRIRRLQFAERSGAHRHWPGRCGGCVLHFL